MHGSPIATTVLSPSFVVAGLLGRREAAIELKTLEALDVPKVAQGVVDELSQRLRIGSDPGAKGLTHAAIPEAQAAKMRRKRDL